MSSNANRQFAKVMTRLESTDPESAAVISRKLNILKSEAATWRRKSQGICDHGETSKMALDDKELVK